MHVGRKVSTTPKGVLSNDSRTIMVTDGYTLRMSPIGDVERPVISWVETEMDVYAVLELQQDDRVCVRDCFMGLMPNKNYSEVLEYKQKLVALADKFNARIELHKRMSGRPILKLEETKPIYRESLGSISLYQSWEVLKVRLEEENSVNPFHVEGYEITKNKGDYVLHVRIVYSDSGRTQAYQIDKLEQSDMLSLTEYMYAQYEYSINHYWSAFQGK